MPPAKNIFSIGRRRGDEDQLTEMLAWLCEMVPEVRAEILDLAEAPPANPAAVDVVTQHAIPGGYLDALLQTDQLAVIVESKLDSAYGTDQLQKYTRWLAEHRPRAQRFLLTLTKTVAPWTDGAEALAASLGVHGTARRWEDLYGRLNRLAGVSVLNEQTASLVANFASMLEEEGLIPIPPIAEGEFADWAASARVVNRFHTFFDSVKSDIGVALDGSPSSNRIGAKSPSGTFQAYQTSYGWFIYLGIWAGSELWTSSPNPRGGSRPVFGAALRGTDDKPIPVAADLTPAGWKGGPSKILYSWPGIWKPLDAVIVGSTFQEQLQCIAAACAAVKTWAQNAYYEHVQSDGAVEAGV